MTSNDDDRMGWPAAATLIALMALLAYAEWLSAAYPEKAPGFSCTSRPAGGDDD